MPMDLADLLATDQIMEIGGKTYTLSRIPLARYPEIQERIRAQRVDTTEIARKLAPLADEKHRREILDRAYTDATRMKLITGGDIDEYILSPEGMMFCFWLSLQEHHPEITEQQACQLLMQKSQEVLAEAFEELRKQFPDVTEAEVAKVAAQQEEGILGELIGRLAGLPAGNSPSSTQPPPDQTDPSPGNGGSAR